MPGYVRGLLLSAIVLLLTVAPFVHYRMTYSHSKRLRVVSLGKVYRSGQMTASGFADALTRHHIRTVINLQDEYPDPDLRESIFHGRTVKEKALCESLGARYVWLAPDLVSRKKVPAERPAAIDLMLELLDDPDTYPVLIHCRAGLHRTGVMVAVYRMEYDGWSTAEAYRELKDMGFGTWACTSANDYVKQYVLNYRPRRGAAHASERRGSSPPSGPPG